MNTKSSPSKKIKTLNKELFAAVSQNNALKVKALINKGAEIDSVHDDSYDSTYKHCTCLYKAINNGSLEIAKELIEAGADVNTPVYLFANKDYDDYPLNAALRRRDRAIEGIKLLLSNGINLSSPQYKTILISLFSCSYYTQQEHKEIFFQCCEELIKAGADISCTSSHGYTPLFLAALNGDDKIVQLLLGNGAELDLASSLLLDKYECVGYFLNKKTCILNDIRFLICQAVEKRNIDLLTKAIKYTQDLNFSVPSNPISNFKTSPLNCTSTYEITKILLKNGADPNYIIDGEKYSSTLCSAVFNDSSDSLKILLENGASPNQLYHDHNVTALHLAVESWLPFQKAELLLNHGANIHAYDTYGCSVMHHVLDNKYYKNSWGTAFAYSEEIMQTITLLLKNNAISNSKDNQGNTPLHLAALNSYSPNILQMLIEAGNDVNDKNYYNETALDLAIKSKSEDTIQFLLSNKSKYNSLTTILVKDTYEIYKFINRIKDFEIRDSDYNNLLHLSIQKGSLAIVRKLVNKGVNINCFNTSKKTPLDLAIEKDEFLLIEFLKIHGALLGNQLTSKTYFFSWLPRNSDTIEINYNLNEVNLEMLKYFQTNGVLDLTGPAITNKQKVILLEVFKYISSIFKINFKETNDITKTDLFISQYEYIGSIPYTIKKHIIGTQQMKANLLLNPFVFYSSRLDSCPNYFYSLLLQGITKILGLDSLQEGSTSVLEYISSQNKKASYSKYDLLFLSSRYNFNKEFLQQKNSILDEENIDRIESIKSVIRQHDIKTLRRLMGSSTEELNYKDDDGNSLMYLASLSGFVSGTKLLYKKGAKLDIASALILGLNDEVTRIANKRDTSLNHEQFSYLMQLGILRDNLPLIKSLINYGIKITDDAFILAIELCNFNMIKLLILAGANVNAKNKEGENALLIASKLGYSSKIINLIKQNIEVNTNSLASNIIDFKTGRMMMT